MTVSELIALLSKLDQSARVLSEKEGEYLEVQAHHVISRDQAGGDDSDPSYVSALGGDAVYGPIVVLTTWG